MPSTDPWVAWLASKVGVAEQPAHSNRTPIGDEYGWNGVAWCAETQSLATLHAFGQWVLHTAGVADARARARAGENGMAWLARDADVRVGDLPCFDFGGHNNPNDMHISGVVNPGTQAKFETIGGNEGDAVRRQWRDRTYVMGFIRLPFDHVGLGAAPTQEDDMSAAAEAQIAEIHNALFDEANGMQNRLARVESQQAVHNGFFGAIIKALGDDDNGIAGGIKKLRRGARVIAAALHITGDIEAKT